MFAFINLLAQASANYNYSYGTDPTMTTSSGQMSGGAVALLLGALLVPMIIMLIITVIIIIGEWKLFAKANKPGWASIIPIYNTIVLLEIVGRPIWWLALMFLPFVNFVVTIIIMIDLAKSFGKDTGFAVLLILLPFIGIPMLGFGNAQYVGPSATGSSLDNLGGVPAAPITTDPAQPQSAMPSDTTPSVPSTPSNDNQPPTPPTGPLIQ